MTSRLSGFLASVFVGLAVIAVDAEAARLGGGRNVGRQAPPQQIQRDATPAQAPQNGVAPGTPAAPAQAVAPRPGAAAAAGAAQPARNRWLGPIAGLAAGLGLAALFSHLGLGAELANFVMIALLVLAAVVVIRLVMARRAGATGRPVMAAPGYGNTAMGPEASVSPASMPGGMARTADTPFGGGSVAAPSAGLANPRIPAGFDAEGFLKAARQQFVRLQSAFDTANLSELREFTADELYPELARQIAERGASSQRTDVVQLNAELLGIDTQAGEYIASVRFHGMIREIEGGAAAPFDEVWNLTKPVSGQSGWLLAGIQQLS